MVLNLSLSELENLEQQSMLYQANESLIKHKDKSWFGNNSFSSPQFLKLAENYSVWLDTYPMSTVTNEANNQSVLNVYSDPKLLSILSDIGIKVIHTNPMQTSGSINCDFKQNQTIDGGYDRINYDIDPSFGTNGDYIEFTRNAKEEDILVAGDVIPGHTGLGADFILALHNYKNYPSLFIMREVAPEDWSILPSQGSSISDNNLVKSYNLNDSHIEKLIKKGYIPGTMSLIMFYEKNIKDSNWSVTDVVIGCDGVKRRWLYLHWFKQGQPSLNWLDPSFTANKLIAGDIVNHRYHFGTSLLRIDANFLLGLEKLENKNALWGLGHPLASLVTKQLSMLMRKTGGFMYEENLAELDKFKLSDEMGPDLSYDFPMRQGYIHALLTGSTDLLNLQQKLVKSYDINHQKMIHALQNHDNLNYELPEFDENPDKIFKYGSGNLTGKEIKDKVYAEIGKLCVKNNLPFKVSFGGVHTHFVEAIAARLDINYKDLLNRETINKAKSDQIKQLMLLAVFYNAMQPGIFQLSSWDLVGSVHKNEDYISEYLKDGDTRWLLRSGVDLMGEHCDKIDKTKFGIPKCYPFFGSLVEQAKDKDSFLNKTKDLLCIRERLQIAICDFIDIIDSHEQGINICLYSNVNKTKYVVVSNFTNEEIDIYKDIQRSLSLDKLNFKEHIADSKNFVVPGFSGRVFEITL